MRAKPKPLWHALLCDYKKNNINKTNRLRVRFFPCTCSVRSVVCALFAVNITFELPRYMYVCVYFFSHLTWYTFERAYSTHCTTNRNDNDDMELETKQTEQDIDDSIQKRELNTDFYGSSARISPPNPALFTKQNVRH